MFLRLGWLVGLAVCLAGCALSPATPAGAPTGTPNRPLPPPQVITQPPPARLLVLEAGQPGADVDADGQADVRLVLAETASGPQLELHPGVRCVANGCESQAQLAVSPCQVWTAAGVPAQTEPKLCLRASTGVVYRLVVQARQPLQTVEVALYAP